MTARRKGSGCKSHVMLQVKINPLSKIANFSSVPFLLPKNDNNNNNNNKKNLAEKVTLPHLCSDRQHVVGPPPRHLRAYKRLKLSVGSTIILGGFAFLAKGVGFTGIRAPERPTGCPTALILVNSLGGALVASGTSPGFHSLSRESQLGSTISPGNMAVWL